MCTYRVANVLFQALYVEISITCQAELDRVNVYKYFACTVPRLRGDAPEETCNAAPCPD